MNVVRIALLSDTHTSDAASGDAVLFRRRLQTAIEAVNSAQVDFAVVAGDLTNDGNEAQTRAFLYQIAGLTVPFLLVPGNHDVGNKPFLPDGITPERVEAYETRIGQPSFGACTLSGVRVVGINSQLMGTGFDREADQWTFLEQELSQPSPIPVLVVSHQPPYLTLPNEAGGDYWNIEPEPRQRLLALLAQGGVNAVLSGHIHRTLTNTIAPTLFFTTPPVAFGLPFGWQPQAWTLVTLVIDERGRAAVSCDIQLIADEPAQNNVAKTS